MFENLEKFYQAVAGATSSVEIIKQSDGSWACNAYDYAGRYVGGSSAGPDEVSFRNMQRDAYEFARFITKPVAREV